MPNWGRNPDAMLTIGRCKQSVCFDMRAGKSVMTKTEIPDSYKQVFITQTTILIY